MSTSGEETRRTLRVYQVDAFTATKFAGNPAAVVSDADALSSDEMQAIRQKSGRSLREECEPRPEPEFFR
jgi:Phenazine biosynthesis-like protein